METYFFAIFRLTQDFTFRKFDLPKNKFLSHEAKSPDALAGVSKTHHSKLVLDPKENFFFTKPAFYG